MKQIYDQPQFGENWFTYPNLYSRFVREIPDGGRMAEIGCWKGKSLSYLGVEVINSGKNIRIDAIDTWSMLDTENYHKTDVYVKSDTLYTLFISNIFPISSVVTPVRMKSLDASLKYADETFDVVFIDACHDYDCVKSDISAWFPKVKSGGYLAGHDYSWCDGVKRAVDESVTPIEVTEGCWVYKKP